VALNDHGSAPSLIPPTKRSLASGPGGNSSLRLNPANTLPELIVQSSRSTATIESFLPGRGRLAASGDRARRGPGAGSHSKGAQLPRGTSGGLRSEPGSTVGPDDSVVHQLGFADGGQPHVHLDGASVRSNAA
jgi:hypothetical protein